MLESQYDLEELANKTLLSFGDLPGMTATDVIKIICLLLTKIVHAITLEPALYTPENRLQLLQFLERIATMLEDEKGNER